MKKKTVAKKATKKTVRKVTKKVTKKPAKKATKKVTKRKYTRRAPALDHEPKEAVEISINVEASEDLLQAVQRDYIESLQAQLKAKDAPSFLETIEILDLSDVSVTEFVLVLQDLEDKGYRFNSGGNAGLILPTSPGMVSNMLINKYQSLKLNHVNRLLSFATYGEVESSTALAKVVSVESETLVIQTTDPGKRVKPSVEVDGQLYDLRT